MEGSNCRWSRSWIRVALVTAQAIDAPLTTERPTATRATIELAPEFSPTAFSSADPISPLVPAAP